MHLELQNMRWEPAYNLFINVQRNWRSGAATVAESQPETDELLAGAAAIQEGCPALPCPTPDLQPWDRMDPVQASNNAEPPPLQPQSTTMPLFFLPFAGCCVVVW